MPRSLGAMAGKMSAIIGTVPIFLSAQPDAVRAQSWQRTGTISGIWDSVAVSADGSKMFAVDGGYNGVGGQIHFSTNSGVTWTLGNAPTLIWTSVATSADGSHCLAVAYSDQIYTSKDPACSADGAKMLV